MWGEELRKFFPSSLTGRWVAVWNKVLNQPAITAVFSFKTKVSLGGAPHHGSHDLVTPPATGDYLHFNGRKMWILLMKGKPIRRSRRVLFYLVSLTLTFLLDYSAVSEPDIFLIAWISCFKHFLKLIFEYLIVIIYESDLIYWDFKWFIYLAYKECLFL